VTGKIDTPATTGPPGVGEHREAQRNSESVPLAIPLHSSLAQVTKRRRTSCKPEPVLAPVN
jgi:hypothetical protein